MDPVIESANEVSRKQQVEAERVKRLANYTQFKESKPASPARPMSAPATPMNYQTHGNNSLAPPIVPPLLLTQSPRSSVSHMPSGSVGLGTSRSLMSLRHSYEPPAFYTAEDWKTGDGYAVFFQGTCIVNTPNGPTTAWQKHAKIRESTPEIVRQSHSGITIHKMKTPREALGMSGFLSGRSAMLSPTKAEDASRTAREREMWEAKQEPNKPFAQSGSVLDKTTTAYRNREAWAKERRAYLQRRAQDRANERGREFTVCRRSSIASISSSRAA